MRSLLLLLLVAFTWPDGSPADTWFSAASRPVKGKEARAFRITAYGAVRNSTEVQTLALQAAIDAAAAAGGGTVVVPKGTWYTGALFFKPHTHLLLKKGATLKGSTDIADYPDVPVHIEGVLQPYAAAILNADACDGFTLSGRGTLDGGGLPFWELFWATRKANPACTNLEVRRPRMISISNSADICISGVKLRDAGFWNIHLYKCRRVQICGVDIEAPVKPVKAPSSDGIDLDGCEDVHISRCRIATGDDLIAVKGGKGPWADTEPDNAPNARILVENCDFGHGPGALVFGSECVKAENVLLRDCRADGTTRLLWLKMRPDTPQTYCNIRLERVQGKVGSVIYVKPWTQFFDLKGREDIPMSRASQVSISDCRLECKKVRRIVEAPDQYELNDFVLEDNNRFVLYE